MRLWPRQLERLIDAANQRGEWVIIDQFSKLPIADRLLDKLETEFGVLFEFSVWDNSMPMRPFVLKGRLHDHIAEAVEGFEDDEWCAWEAEDFGVDDDDEAELDPDFAAYLEDAG